MEVVSDGVDKTATVRLAWLVTTVDGHGRTKQDAVGEKKLGLVIMWCTVACLASIRVQTYNLWL
jgi:hypothetical protein